MNRQGGRALQEKRKNGGEEQRRIWNFGSSTRLFFFGQV